MYLTILEVTVIMMTIMFSMIMSPSSGLILLLLMVGLASMSMVKMTKLTLMVMMLVLMIVGGLIVLMCYVIMSDPMDYGKSGSWMGKSSLILVGSSFGGYFWFIEEKTGNRMSEWSGVMANKSVEMCSVCSMGYEVVFMYLIMLLLLFLLVVNSMMKQGEGGGFMKV